MSSSPPLASSAASTIGETNSNLPNQPNQPNPTTTVKIEPETAHHVAHTHSDIPPSTSASIPTAPATSTSTSASDPAAPSAPASSTDSPLAPIKSDSPTDTETPTIPAVFAIPVDATPPVRSALEAVHKALEWKKEYRAAASSYETFLRTKTDLAIMHGSTPAYHQLVVQQQIGLKRSLPFELVHAHSEREEEIRHAEEIYRALDRPIPVVERKRVWAEIVRPRGRGSRPPAAAPSPYERVERPERSERAERKSTASTREHVSHGAANVGIAAGSGVRTIYGQTNIRRYADAAASNPLLHNTDRASAYDESGQRGSSWSSLAQARSQARKNGALMPSFPLVYSSFVSSLGTWFNPADLAARVRVKENANWLTWVECYGYALPDGDESYEKLPMEVKKDLEIQWRDFGQPNTRDTKGIFRHSLESRFFF